MSETIVALATPAGDSALATIRISGSLSECFTKDAFFIPRLTDIDFFNLIPIKTNINPSTRMSRGTC